MKVEYKALRVERKTLSKMSGRRHITLSRLGKYYIILAKSNYNAKMPSPGSKLNKLFAITCKESFLNANSIYVDSFCNSFLIRIKYPIRYHLRNGVINDRNIFENPALSCERENPEWENSK